MLSLSKSTLIMDLSPLICIFFSFFILQERLEWVSIVSVVVAFCGIYMLTLNQTEGKDTNLPYEIFYASLTAVIEAFIIIATRKMNIYQILPLIRWVYQAVVNFLLSLVIVIVLPGVIIVNEYDKNDMIFLSLQDIGMASSYITTNLAFKYESASRLSPIMYLENVFSLTADLLLFGYKFVLSDYIGIFLILLWLIIPAILEIMKENK